jgi:hypothetical protein
LSLDEASGRAPLAAGVQRDGLIDRQMVIRGGDIMDDIHRESGAR